MQTSEQPSGFVFRRTELSIAAERVWLDGLLSHAPDARGLVVFLDNGAGRLHDPLQRLLTSAFEAARYAWIGIDLLTRYEENRDPDACFNVPQMHHRLLSALDWIQHQPQLHVLPLAIVAAGTTTAAAIRAAAERPDRVLTLACLAGRPDLAGAGPLSRVQCPTRFIVGADDPGRDHHHLPAFRLLSCPTDWAELPGLSDDLHSAQAIKTLAPVCLEWIGSQLPRTIPPQALDDEG